MTLEVDGVEFTYEIRSVEETDPRYEIALLYVDAVGGEALDRVALEVAGRRAVTKELVEARLNEWTAERPGSTLQEFAVLEIAVSRWGRDDGGAAELDVAAMAGPRHPSHLRADDEDWDELLYDRGDVVEYSVGGQSSRVYGTETGEIVGTSGSGRTYWIDIGEERKRVPEDWIVDHPED